MVDYKPLLREAIQAQDNHSQAGRAALYERARAAQSKTFQASDPPLTKAEMASRRKELQTAIYEIEREFPDGFTAKQPLQGKRGDKLRFEDFDPIAALIGSELNGHGQGAGTSVAVPSTPPRPSKPIANSADYSDDLIAELAALMGGAPTASPTETSKVIRIPGMNPAPPTEATPVTKFDFAAKPAIATPIKSEPLSTLVGRLGKSGASPALPRGEAAPPKPLPAAVEPQMAKPTPEGFYIKPVVFKVPQAGVEPDYLSVMMPFRTDFNPVYKAIEKAAKEAGFRVQRADKVWEDQIIVEDVFSMIYRSAVVVCDFSGKNPNVMYEAGIAHTLGRTVVPITQVETDLPFDIRHHRALPYENHSKGRTALKKQLITRFKMLALSGATKQ